MLNEFFIEKVILDKVYNFEIICREIKVHVSKRIRHMAQDLGKTIPPEILQKMCEIVEKPQKKFDCRECGRTFTDGRQLGGHISRAHKKIKESKQHMETEGICLKGKSLKKNKKIKKKSKDISDKKFKPKEEEFSFSSSSEKIEPEELFEEEED